MENQWSRRAKKLTQALLFSVALNIGLLTSFAYLALKEKQETVAFAPKSTPKETTALEDSLHVLRSYSTLSYPELLLTLENQEFVEAGLTKRDLALACLVAFHHFDIDKALGGISLPKRQIPFSSADGQDTIDLTVFPGLAHYQFEAVCQYAKTEKYPFTSQGLFYEIQRHPLELDPSLIEAFQLSPEFRMVQMLFVRTGIAISKAHLLQLLAEGNWQIVSAFASQQRENPDFSPDQRRQFLARYLDLRSKLATRILLETDLDFALKRLDDPQILTLFDLLPENAPEIEPLAKGVLSGPRTDALWARAAHALFALAKEPPPEPYNHELVLRRFLPDLLPHKEIPSPPCTPASKQKVHLVAEGENLWKIARKHRVSVDTLKQLNHLENDKLRPGKQLLLPDNAQ